MSLLPRYRKAELGIISLALLFYFLNRFTSIFPGDFARYHLNDLIAGIISPAYVNLVLSFSRYRFRINSIGRTLVFGLILSLWFEGLSPLILPHSTADIVDAACYIIGGCIYLLITKTAVYRRLQRPAYSIKRINQ